MYEPWLRRDLRAKRLVYFWADSGCFRLRLEHDGRCLLLMIGVDEISNRYIIGLRDGYHESAQSWLKLLPNLKRRCLSVSRELSIGDGALSF